MVSWGGHGYPPHDPRPLSPRRRRPSSSAAPLIASGEAFASTGAEPECTKSSSLDEVHGGLRPSPLARERRRRSERTWVLEHRSAAPLPRGLGEAKTRDRRASWSVKIPAMPFPHACAGLHDDKPFSLRAA